MADAREALAKEKGYDSVFSLDKEAREAAVQHEYDGHCWWSAWRRNRRDSTSGSTSGRGTWSWTGREGEWLGLHYSDGARVKFPVPDWEKSQ